MNNEDKVKYGLKLKEYRKTLNLTQEEVVNKAKEFVDNSYAEDENYSEKTCFNQNQLSNWEKGKYIPHHINRFLLSVVYNVPVEELEPNYPQNVEKELENYIQSLIQEDNQYISKDNMVFESEDEIKEIIGDSVDIKDNEAFRNGTFMSMGHLSKVQINTNWSIQKRLEYIINLHVGYGLLVPNQLLNALNETDSEKKSQMYYEYYINLYNGALYARKKHLKK